MLKPVDFYIDLGTANTLIYARGRGFLLNEPSVLTVHQKTSGASDLIALGRSAKLMLGKTPEKLSVLRPLREGVIADFENTAKLLHAFIQRAKENIFWFKPRMIISLPCRVSEFEKKAVEELGYDLGARRVHLLDEPLAAAIGAGMPILGNRGQMMIDIGGGTTEIAILSLGGIVASNAVRIGGNDIDAMIIEQLRTRYHFAVGEQTAEKIKMMVGSAVLGRAAHSQIEIGGINLKKGLPESITVTEEMIFPAINHVVKEIISAVHKILESCPPEISADLAERGAMIAGGGALLSGLQLSLQQELGIAIQISSDPLFSVAMGGAKTLEDSKLFDLIERPQT